MKITQTSQKKPFLLQVLTLIHFANVAIVALLSQMPITRARLLTAATTADVSDGLMRYDTFINYPPYRYIPVYWPETLVPGRQMGERFPSCFHFSWSMIKTQYR